MIASLPKSASAYVASVSSLLLEVPVCRISAGQFPNFQVIPGWARQVALGGAVTHEHFGPSTHNLDAIKAAGLRHVAVQIRDPRQTLISYVHIDAVIEMMPEAAKSEVTDRVGWALQSYFGQMVRWIGDWAEIADLQPAGLRSADLQSEALDPGLEICMVSFEDFVADKARYLLRLVALYLLRLVALFRPAGGDQGCRGGLGQTRQSRHPGGQFPPRRSG